MLFPLVPRFKTPGDDYARLLCPKCGESYLHHGAVAIQSRKKEDGSGLEISIENGTVNAHCLSSNRLRGRRSSLTIDFECEFCGPPGPTLLIEQHKGETMMSWLEEPPE